MRKFYQKPLQLFIKKNPYVIFKRQANTKLHYKKPEVK
jgi:hypothetical protein